MMKIRRTILKIIFISLSLNIVFWQCKMPSYEYSTINSENCITSLPFNDILNRCLLNKTWGGAGNDFGYGVALDKSGNIFITGYTSSYGEGHFDVFLLKFDFDGDLLWYEIWGGKSYDYGNELAVDESGNVFVIGNTFSYGEGAPSAFLLKYNPDGDLLWNKSWGTEESMRDLVLDNSGNIFITGTSRIGVGSDKIVLLKFGSDGNLLLNQTFSSSNRIIPEGIEMDSLGNIYIAGSTSNEKGDEVILLKFTSEGNLLWYQTWGGSENDFGHGIALDNSGNIFITGSTFSYGEGNCDLFLLKYDFEGNLTYFQTWGDYGSDAGEGIALDKSGNIIITGYTDSYAEGETDIFLLKYYSNGSLIWNKMWKKANIDIGIGMILDNNENTVITGWTDSYGEGKKDVLLLKYGVDTDNDGISNIDEIDVFFTDPNKSDSDFDRLNDGLEIELGTNPLNNDTDSDLLPDGWEFQFQLNPLMYSKDDDPDKDDLTNYNEYLCGTNPQLDDTDGDGFLDGEEVALGTNPLDPDDNMLMRTVDVFRLPLILAFIIVILYIIFRRKRANTTN